MTNDTAMAIIAAAMEHKTLIREIQAATGMSQAAIGAAIGRSQAWVADVLSGRYKDLKSRDANALAALHAEKVGKEAA